MTRPEAHVKYFGKKYQTEVVTHEGYRRVVKWLNKTQEVIKDEVKVYKNHPKDCRWCEQ